VQGRRVRRYHALVARTAKHRPKNPRRDSPLGALRILDPDKWERTIRKAMKDAKGRIPDAAETLGIGVRQLFRLLTDPRLSNVERAPPGTHRD
jgi:DNA-binding NtrC family response regulator